MIKKIKAFTLSETLVTLTIIGVIMAIIIPVTRHTVAGTEGLLYKKAYTDIQNAADNAFEELEKNNPYGIDTRYYFLQLKPQNLCEIISDELSIVGSANCSSNAATPEGGSASFMLANGFKYWNVGGSGTYSFYNDTTPCTPTSYNRNCVRTIWVDVNGDKKGKNTYGKDQFKFLLKYNGQVTIGSGSDWQIEQDIIENGKF